MELDSPYFIYLGRCLEGFFSGLYSGIFAMYLQHHRSRQSTDKAKNIIFYALWALYALSGATKITSEILVGFGLSWRDVNIEIVYHFQLIQFIVFAFCEFIAQFILIYRCWIVWGYSIHVMIIPSVVAFAFLAIWIAAGTAVPLSIVLAQDHFSFPAWRYILTLTGLTLSMTVNALVTGLIVFRIFKVFQEVKTGTAYDQSLGVTGGSTFWSVMFILIESGVALFSVQLVRLVVTILTTDAAADSVYFPIVGIHEMLNVIIRSIIAT